MVQQLVAASTEVVSRSLVAIGRRRWRSAPATLRPCVSPTLSCAACGPSTPCCPAQSIPAQRTQPQHSSPASVTAARLTRTWPLLNASRPYLWLHAPTLCWALWAQQRPTMRISVPRPSRWAAGREAALLQVPGQPHFVRSPWAVGSRRPAFYGRGHSLCFHRTASLSLFGAMVSWRLRLRMAASVVILQLFHPCVGVCGFSSTRSLTGLAVTAGCGLDCTGITASTVCNYHALWHSDSGTDRS